jgi:hypothetical protein
MINSDRLKNKWLMLIVFSSVATSLTIYHSLLYPDPLWVFYLVVISFFLTLLIIALVIGTSKTKNSLRNLSRTSIFLFIYIVLIIWLGINKTIPEHEEILEFQDQRKSFIYWRYKPEYDTKKELALLYMNASPAIRKIEPNANHFGTTILSAYLENEIAAGNGSRHAKDMYSLAEAAFVYSSRDLAHTWYQHAYDHGIKNSLSRYEKRISQ